MVLKKASLMQAARTLVHGSSRCYAIDPDQHSIRQVKPDGWALFAQPATMEGTNDKGCIQDIREWYREGWPH